MKTSQQISVFTRSTSARLMSIAIISYALLYWDAESHMRAVPTFLFFTIVTFFAVAASFFVAKNLMRHIVFMLAFTLFSIALSAYLAYQMNLSQKLNTAYIFSSGKLTLTGLFYLFSVSMVASFGLVLLSIVISCLQRKI
jgi:hypothetical protein